MIIKSKVDKNEYLSLVLPNKIKVLLVSNPEYAKSSCCLSVRVGSLDEPAEFPGLAHFLEHMLFMGTEKYPNENDFGEYLTQHSGYSNAYTDNEMTVYFYEVDSNYFEGSADRFAQFFTAPLLAKSSVDREVNAVNSEFLNSLTNRHWRRQRVIEDLMLECRPESRFTCGNNETLQKENILEAVREFEKTQYSSDLMSLVVCGKESLEDLEKIANLFKKIKNIERKKSVDSRMIDEPKQLFKPDFMSKVVQYAPLDEKKELVIVFVLQRMRERFDVNPLQYIGFLLGTKEPHGLIARITKEKLGFDLDFNFEHFLEYTTVNISIDLTVLGSKNQKKVLDLVYSYLKGMEVSEKEYNRLRRIRSEEFEYTQPDSSIDLTCSLGPELHYFPVENILNHSYVLENFDQKLINDVIQRMLDVSKWIVLLADKEGTFNMNEKVYNVDYCIHSDYSPTVVEFTKINSLLPDQFLDKVKILTGEHKRFYKNKSFENGEVHHVFDSKFGIPKSEVFITLSGEEIQNNLISTEIFFALADEFFSEEYARQMCNFHLDISLDTSITGVKIKFEGHSDKILEMAEKFFLVLEDLNLSKFETVRKEIEDMYSNKINESPFKRTLEVFSSKFFSSKTSEELLNEVKFIKKEQIKLPENFYVKILAVGNLEWENVVGFYKKIANSGKKIEIKMPSLLPVYTFETIDKFNNGITVFYNVNTLARVAEPEINFEVDENNEENENDLSSVELCDYHIKAVVGNLIHQIAEDLFFNQLRTQEQLGYIVYSGFKSFSSAKYLTFTVQSEETVKFLEDRIAKFIVFLKDHIQQLKDEDLDNFKESLACVYEEPIISLEDLSTQCYNQLHTGSIDLNLGSKMACKVMALSKEELLESKIFDSYQTVYSIKATE